MPAKTQPRGAKQPVRYLSVHEVGAERGVGPEAVRKDIRKGLITADAVTGATRGFTRETVDAYLDRFAGPTDATAADDEAVS